MSSNPIVCVLGNSVPLLIQPFRRNASEKTYVEHLRESGFSVINGSKQSAILSDLYFYLEDECTRHFPDYVVFHFGIVECTYRARPRWLQDYFSMNAWNNSVINKGYNSGIKRGIKFVGKRVYRKLIERPLFAMGIKRRWLNPKEFQFVLRDVVKRVFSDTPAKKLILVGMPPVSPWVERQAPGTQASITEYNEIFRSLSKEYENIVFFDPTTLAAPEQMKELTEDGIHYTAEGHAALARALEPLLKGERIAYTDWQTINQYKGLYTMYENWYKRKTPRPE